MEPMAKRVRTTVSEPVRPSPSVRQKKVAACVVCGETKPILGRGMCDKDYQRFRRSSAAQSVRLTEELTELQEEVTATQAAIIRAKQRLIEAVPDVVEDLLAASKVAAAKGDARPAIAVLEGVQIDDKDTTRRLLTAPAKAPASASVGQLAIQVVIPGGQLGGWRGAALSETVDAE